MGGPARPLVCCGAEPAPWPAPPPRVQLASHGDVMVVRLLGTLEGSGTAHARHRLLKCLADVPSVLVVDVSALRVRRGVLERLLVEVAQQNELWPRVPMVATGTTRGRADLESEIGSQPLLDVAPSAVDALRHLPRPPARTRHTARLPARTMAAPRARSMVGVQCQQWGADHLAESAELVTSELVTSAVCHVGFGIRLTVETDGDCMAVEVRDPDPAPPKLVDAGPLDDQRHALDVLCSTVNTWGCLPTRPGGKVVWATWALSEGYAEACAQRYRAS